MSTLPFTLYAFAIMSIGFIGCVIYASMRYRLMDINRISAKILEKGIYFGFQGILYGVVTILIGIIFFPQFVNLRFIVITLLTCFAIRMFLEPLQRYTHVFTQYLFAYRVYSREKILSHVQQIIQVTIDHKTLIYKVLQTIATQMSIHFVAYVSFVDGKVLTFVTYPKEIKKQFPKKSLNMFATTRERIVTEDLEKGEFKTFLKKKHIALVFPFHMTKTPPMRLFLLGKKQHKSPYFQYDYVTLKDVTSPFVIGMQHARYLQNIKNFNKNLQKEVDRATKELLRVNAQLRHADKRKDEFISIASHELKTPTTAIHGFLWLILQKDTRLSAYSREKIEKVAKLTDQITTLVNDMLDVSKIESKRISLHPEKFDIVELVEEIKGELDLIAIQKNIAIAVTNGRAYRVWADKQRARQILNNLLSNAVKYTLPDGKVGIRFKQYDGKVEVLVKDTGIGIRPEDMPRLFTKFGKLENGNAASAHLPGTGLGLYIAKNLVELSGGNIAARSTHGKGSTFTFSLPSQDAIIGV